MKLADLANDMGVSTRTIYRKLERKGLKIADYRNDTGEITTEGAQIIAALFDTVETDKTSDKQRQGTGQKAKNDTADERCHALEVENASLKAKLEGLNRENTLLKQMLEKAEAAAEDWKEQATRAQQLHAAQMQLLPERVGVWQRIKNVFTGKKEEQQG